MVLTRATNTAVQAGTDGVFGTSDDVHFHNNETTPFVDQNQTYTSHASHQVFLREYAARRDRQNGRDRPADRRRQRRHRQLGRGQGSGAHSIWASS